MEGGRCRLVGAWVALVFAAACPSDLDPKTGLSGSTHLLDVGEVCSVQEECRQGLSCDPNRRICVCTSDASCDGRRLCNPFSGMCVEVDEVPGCTRDLDCGADQWCDTAARVCSPKQQYCGPCGRDEDCVGVGSRCLAAEDGRRFCAMACDGRGCPHGSSCLGGQCVPDKGCAGLVRCTPDTFQACSVTADCTLGKDQLCEPALGACVARQSGCEAGFACSPDQECEASCLSDDACPYGNRCVNGVCRQTEGCEADGDCRPGLACRRAPGAPSGECVRACAANSDCPIGEICEQEGGARACRPGCDGDSDCPPDARCDLVAGICDTRQGGCQSADVCGPCEECRGGRCRFAFDEEFPDRRYCAPCDSNGPDSDCGLGGFCIDGRCAPPCPKDGCPKGFLCQTLVDSSGFAYGWGCHPQDGRCDMECL
ncbi:MAG TPA: hypothetical protein VGD74_04260 [Vulgatibacter sp.]